MSLDDLREDINRLDEQIVRLLDDRAQTAKLIALAKHKESLPLHNPQREEEVLLALSTFSNGSLPLERLTRIYRLIMSETLDYEKELVATNCPSDSPAKGKLDRAAKIVENRAISSGFWRMRLHCPELAEAFQPGQFFQIAVSGTASDLFLRRPFAPSEMFKDGFAFVYAVVGKGTGMMTTLQAGDTVQVLAPLGNGYTLPAKGSKVALIGGGCGGPSLGPLAKVLAASGVKAVVTLGARTSGSLVGADCFSKEQHTLVTATDDGSAGFAGTSVSALENKLGNDIHGYAKIYACGPIPMLKAAAALAKKYSIECEVSLEERMACGFGACVGCAIEVKNSDGTTAYKRVCHDGPVFNSRDLAWDIA